MSSLFIIFLTTPFYRNITKKWHFFCPEMNSLNTLFMPLIACATEFVVFWVNVHILQGLIEST